MLTIYGIKNCDTMKKAMLWLNEQGLDYHFHDYKKEGLDDTLLKTWLETLGWQTLINQQGTTWRKLAIDKTTLNNDFAFDLIKNNLSLIKRPLVAINNQRTLLGFNVQTWQDQLISIKHD